MTDKKPEGNPAFRAIGLPRLRARLPSRNWTIFLTVFGSFTAAIIYDRREKRKVQQKWCNAVSYMSEEIMPSNKLPRKLTVYLSAPPGDGLRAAREHFQEYVKPMLVAAAIDWEVVEGRKEGDVRAASAERIRQSRRRHGETSIGISEGDVLQEIREKFNVTRDLGSGDIIIGRHTWKEYLRGIHEGWLGPIDPPGTALNITPEALSSEQPENPPSAHGTDTETFHNNAVTPSDDIDNAAGIVEGDETVSNSASTIRGSKAIKPASVLSSPYIQPQDYSNSVLPLSIPQRFEDSIAIPFPHLLGFLNTPIRIYRFLNRRTLADEIGERVVSIIVSRDRGTSYELFEGSPEAVIESPELWEQQNLLIKEESDWHKSAHKAKEQGEEAKERPWLEEVIIDERIGSRMLKPEPISDFIASSQESTDLNTERKLFDDGSKIRGKYRDWKGGADQSGKISWYDWALDTIGLGAKEERCKGWEHGMIGGDDD